MSDLAGQPRDAHQVLRVFATAEPARSSSESSATTSSDVRRRLRSSEVKHLLDIQHANGYPGNDPLCLLTGYGTVDEAHQLPHSQLAKAHLVAACRAAAIVPQNVYDFKRSISNVFFFNPTLHRQLDKRLPTVLLAPSLPALKMAASALENGWCHVFRDVPPSGEIRFNPNAWCDLASPVLPDCHDRCGRLRTTDIQVWFRAEGSDVPGVLIKAPPPGPPAAVEAAAGGPAVQPEGLRRTMATTHHASQHGTEWPLRWSPGLPIRKSALQALPLATHFLWHVRQLVPEQERIGATRMLDEFAEVVEWAEYALHLAIADSASYLLQRPAPGRSQSFLSGVQLTARALAARRRYLPFLDLATGADLPQPPQHESSSPRPTASDLPSTTAPAQGSAADLSPERQPTPDLSLDFGSEDSSPLSSPDTSDAIHLVDVCAQNVQELTLTSMSERSRAIEQPAGKHETILATIHKRLLQVGGEAHLNAKGLAYMLVDSAALSDIQQWEHEAPWLAPATDEETQDSEWSD